MIRVLFCGHMVSFFMGVDLEVALLGHMVTVCLILEGIAKVFSKQAVPILSR